MVSSLREEYLPYNPGVNPDVFITICFVGVVVFVLVLGILAGAHYARHG